MLTDHENRPTPRTTDFCNKKVTKYVIIKALDEKGQANN